MAQSKIDGYCSICGEFGKLTQEHVPPKRAFNNARYYLAAFDFEHPFSITGKKKIMQGGVKFFTLCASCNNSTGSWYAKEYIDWCYRGLDIIKHSRGKTSLYHISEIHPLRIIKQIIVMFFSINNSFLRQHQPYLSKFVLDRNRKHLPPEIKIFAYFNIEGHPRYNSFSVVGDFKRGGSGDQISEFTFPPYGFVMSFQKDYFPPQDLTEISHFADYSYETKWNVDLNLKTLPTWMPVPLDYRTKNEIERTIEENKKYL